MFNTFIPAKKLLKRLIIGINFFTFLTFFKRMMYNPLFHNPYETEKDINFYFSITFGCALLHSNI